MFLGTKFRDSPRVSAQKNKIILRVNFLTFFNFKKLKLIIFATSIFGVWHRTTLIKLRPYVYLKCALHAV